MITLITGTPGSGKTLYAVWLASKMVKEGRRLVVDGIRDLAVEHLEVDEAWVRRWWEGVQPNDVMIIDEVQRYWPPVSVSVKTPEEIEKLHVHRHLGVDIIVITQHPQRLNKTIRDLVGHHVHVRRMFGLKRAMLYEWDHCHNPNSGFRDSVKTLWKYPRSVFSLYLSSELHTKPKSVVPKALFVIPIALVAAGVLAWRGYHGVKAVGDVHPGASDAGTGGAAVAAAGASSARGLVSREWRVVGQYAVDGRGYVLVADNDGRLRSADVDDFRGDSLRVEGKVDGERVAVWTGGKVGGVMGDSGHSDAAGPVKAGVSK